MIQLFSKCVQILHNFERIKMRLRIGGMVGAKYHSKNYPLFHFACHLIMSASCISID